MKKHEDLYEKIYNYYDNCDDVLEEGNFLNKKLIWLKSNKWREHIKEMRKKGRKAFFKKGIENICDIIIFGSGSPSGNNITYWDIIKSYFSNKKGIYIQNFVDYTTSCLPKIRKEGNELLNYIIEMDFEFGGYIELTIK